MPCNAEFGIINCFDKSKDYGGEYDPTKYSCVAIDDDVINDWWERLTTMKTYFHCYNCPETALARWGITLIPPESLDLFYDIVANDTKKDFINQIPRLLELITKAKDEKTGLWYCKFVFTDWSGNKKQKKKNGFQATKRGKSLRDRIPQQGACLV